MAAETILTAFRTISGLTTTQFADLDVTDKAENYALDFYNEVMGTAETITDHTTSDYMVDRALAFLCASYAYSNLFPRMAGPRGMTYWDLEQVALSIMQKIEPSKVGFSTSSRDYYVLRNNRGNARFTAYAGTVS